MIEMKRENLGELKGLTEQEKEVALDLPETVKIRKEGKYFAIPVIDKRGKEQEVLVYKTVNGEEEQFLVIYEVLTKQGVSSKAVRFTVNKGYKDIEVLKEIVKEVLKDVEIKEILRKVDKEQRKKISRMVLFKEYEGWQKNIEKKVEDYVDNKEIGLSWEVEKKPSKEKQQEKVKKHTIMDKIELDTKVFLGKVVKGTKEQELYRVLNTKVWEVKDFTKEDIIRSNFKIENIEYSKEKDEMVGTNGVLSRYGTAGEKAVVVILAELNIEGKTSYIIATNNTINKSQVVISEEQQLVKMAKKMGLANGKVVSVAETGKEHISSIRGEYTKIE